MKAIWGLILCLFGRHDWETLIVRNIQRKVCDRCGARRFTIRGAA